MRSMVLEYLATKLGDFVVNVGVHIPALISDKPDDDEFLSSRRDLICNSTQTLRVAQTLTLRMSCCRI